MFNLPDLKNECLVIEESMIKESANAKKEISTPNKAEAVKA
jgi:hypothetical protein